jgi:hypothetical protein
MMGVRFLKYALIFHIIMGNLHIYGAIGDFLASCIIYSIVTSLVVFTYIFAAIYPEQFYKLLMLLKIRTSHLPHIKSKDLYMDMTISQLMLFYYRAVKEANEFYDRDKHMKKDKKLFT